jgi:hypothetical protein
VRLAALLLALAGCGGGFGPGSSSGEVASGPGPWPVANVSYGAADGIQERSVVGLTTDAAQNRWLATNAALYLLKPGETRFRRFDSRSGLHLPDNAVRYCDRDFTGGDRSCPIFGAATAPGIRTIEGGSSGEVFVGYYGRSAGAGDWTDPDRHSGKVDRVRLQSDGSLQVDRMDLVSSVSAQFWENRRIERMLYDHGRRELYVGTNHGVDRIQPDAFRNPKPGEWFLTSTHEWLSDHLHPRVCFHTACTGDENKDTQMIGDWRGLSLAADGNLWVAGKWTAGKIRWTQQLSQWHARTGADTFEIAFGDPYDAATGRNPPVFRPPREGDPVDMSAVAVARDGTVWFASGPQSSGPRAYGIASWDGKAFRYFDPVRDAGLPESNVRDLVALPDGRLAVASFSALVLWDPTAGRHTAVSGLPGGSIQMLELDGRVAPATLHVATELGAEALRVLP